MKVDVIQCKDCKNLDKIAEKHNIAHCIRFDRDISFDWYCADAEPIEVKETDVQIKGQTNIFGDK